MEGKLKTDGAVESVYGLRFSKIVYSERVQTAWCDQVDLVEISPGAKTRRARVWIRVYDSRNFTRVFMEVRLPVEIKNNEAICLAAHKAYRVGKPHSWMTWVRCKIREKHGDLVNDPAFKRWLKRMTFEWNPRVSQEGRNFLSDALGLGSFEVEAFSNLKIK